MMRSRLQQLFGSTSSWLLVPQRSALLCLAAWLFTIPLTWHHPWLALLGFSAMWALLLALWLEAPLLEALPLPPLTVLLIGLSTRWGLGPLFLSFVGSGDDPFVDIWVTYGPQAQLLWIALTAALLFFVFLQRRVIVRAASTQPRSPWILVAKNHHRFRAQLTALASLLSLYIAFYILSSLLSGAFDRQFETYARWTQQLWRFDTPVAAFSRLRDLWFLLFPLWWAVLSRPWRFLLGAELLTFFSLAIISGSRGLVFYPALLLLCGLWFVTYDTRLLRRLALIFAALLLVLSPLIYVVRDSSAFQQAESLSVRVQSFGVIFSNPEPFFSKARWLGRDLYACHDPYLFTPENKDKPRAGNTGLDSLLYLWVPKHVFPARPVVFDGHLIAKQLQRIQRSPWSEVWFPCFSLPADLLRRWSFSGLLLGSIAVAFCVQSLFFLWYRNISVPGSTYQLLLTLLPATYLQSFPFGTVSETAWAFLWELPKYLLCFWLIGAAVDSWLKRMTH